MSDHGGRPWAGEPRGEHPTEQFWQGDLPHAGAKAGSAGPGGQSHPGWQATPGGLQGPGGMQGTGHAWALAPDLDDHMRRDRRRATHRALGLVAAVLLAAGGIIAGVALTGHQAPATASGAASGPVPGAQTGGGQAAGGRAGGGNTAAAGTSTQGALLNATLSGASAPGRLQVSASSAAGPQQRAAVPGRAGACARMRHWARAARRAGFPRVARARRIAAHRCRLVRRLVFRFYVVHGVDGQFTVQTPRGMKTLAFERGVVQSVSAGELVVKAANGTTWTWHFVSSTVVRDRGGKVARGAVSVGETVWAGGPVISGARDARLIIIHPPTAGS